MTDANEWRRAWALLDVRERRHGWITLSIVIVAAMSSALMVGSVLPFLSVLSNPDQIRQVPVLAWFYETFGFSDDFAFLVALGSGSFAIVVVSNLIQIAKTYEVAQFRDSFDTLNRRSAELEMLRRLDVRQTFGDARG